MREWDIGPDVDGLKLDRGGIVGCAIGGEGRDILETLGSNEAEYGDEGVPLEWECSCV